jgi:cytochrome P450
MERAVEVAVLAALSWPLLRVGLCRAFRRRLGASPEVAIALGGALGGYALVVVGVATFAPWLVRPLAVVAAVVLLAGWWRARPRYGRARGLPPGSLALAPRGPWTDDQFYAKQAATYGPIFKTSHVVYPTVCIIGLPAARDLFRRHDAALDTPPARFSQFIRRGFLRYMDAADHRVYSAVLRTAVAETVVHACEPFIAGTVRAELLRLATAGSGAKRGVPAHEATSRIVFVVFMRLFFGIEPESADLRRLGVLYPIVDFRHAWRATRTRVLNALDEIVAIVRRRAVDGCFLGEVARAHPAALHDETVMKNLVYMAQTAGADLAGLLCWTLKMLSDHPQWVARLRQDERGVRLALAIVMETLRLEQSEFLTRRARQEIRWQGFVIPKGWRLRVCVRESHRSAQAFDNPTAFDPERFLEGTPRAIYSPFGASTSRISCLGEHLTHTAGRIFVEELVRGFDWTVVADGPREFDGFHWRPSSRFRIALVTREGR